MALSRKTPLKRGTLRPRTRRRTGPAADVRQLVVARAANRCERCGESTAKAPYSIHHRKPRAAGGTKDPSTNSPANLLLLCGTGTTGCHGWVESHRAAATEQGWLVPSWANPEETPVNIRGTRRTLNPGGDYGPAG